MSERRLDHPQFAEMSSEILARGEAIKFKAHGTSMRPFIEDGDVLTVYPTIETNWYVGQILFYQAVDQKLLAHRIIKKRFANGKLLLRVRGDAMDAIEEEISEDRVLGEIIYRQRGDRSIRIDRGWWRVAGVVWLWMTRVLRWLWARTGRNN